MRGLVQHVEHAGEAGADLRGEPDALALAAGERAGGAGEGEVFEADVDQELEPIADFLQHADRDLVLLGGELLGQRGEPIARGAAPTGRGDSPMWRPAIFTHSASGLRRQPAQAPQGMSVK